MACRLYEYYEDALEKSVYNDPSGGPDQIDLLRCTTQNQPHQSRMLSVRVNQTLMELCVVCLLHNPLVWGYIARTSGKLEYHEHLNNTSRNADVLAVITYQQKATLLHTSAQLCDKFCSKAVIDYCTNSMCYRRMLLNYFNVSQDDKINLPSADVCCSLCSAKCVH